MGTHIHVPVAASFKGNIQRSRRMRNMLMFVMVYVLTQSRFNGSLIVANECLTHDGCYSRGMAPEDTRIKLRIRE